MPGQLDDDIAALSMSDVEKNGLQIYRNYSRAFENDLRNKFVAGVDKTKVDIEQLKSVMELVATDDIRFVPVIACAYADDLFKEMFKKFIPDGVPGGKRDFLGGFGPISTLASRIQHAFAFDMMHQDILKGLDILRGHRNKISHRWNPNDFKDFFETPLPGMDEIESAILHRLAKQGEQFEPPAEARMRMQVIWLLSRVFYEAHFYPLAKAANLNPQRTLYQGSSPVLLKQISMLAIEFTKQVIDALP